ncbi:peritrophin-48 [Drosophila rhopaloa]|uniref:Chitin-binding type-2 domain-containing protein n=1 Tax=Drosophila rhopaloa TaxID=1041015 RepID=A0ABM5H3E9_DRORH|nr:peritrophin-48 [Drosophila rhopaloa]
MDTRFVLFFGLIMVPLISGASTFNATLICELVVNGTKMNDPRACDAWIQCIDGQPVGGTCGTDLFYDRESEKCLSSDSVKCLSSDPCAALATGFAADPYSCNGYYYCRDGKGTHGVCNSGMNYNPGTQDCIRGFKCTDKMDPDSYCNILPDGVFVKDSDNCNGYQMCWDGVVINGTCPGTFYFKASTAACDYPQDVECDFTPKPDIAEKGLCPETGGFVSDNRTCNGYYYCKDMGDGQFALEHGECSDGRFFLDTDGGACVPRSKVKCDFDRCVGLGNSTIQLANESDDGCRGYSICQDGVVIGQGTCPQEEYFDEVTQRCTTQAISYPACQISGGTTGSQVDQLTAVSDGSTTVSVS